MQRALEIGPGPTANKKRGDYEWHFMDCVPRNLPNFQQCNHLGQPGKFLPYRDNSFHLIYMSHIIEHLPWYYLDVAMIQLYKILAYTGKIEIHTVDFRKIVEAYIKNQIPAQDKWRRFNPESSVIKWVNGRLMAYGQNHENKAGDEQWHHAVFDFKFMQDLLQRNKFVNVTQGVIPRFETHGWINLGVSAEKGPGFLKNKMKCCGGGTK